MRGATPTEDGAACQQRRASQPGSGRLIISSYRSDGFAHRLVASFGTTWVLRPVGRAGPSRRGLIGVWPPASTEACPPTGPCNTLRVEGSRTMMVVLGVDAHKRSHTIVACDGAGAQLGSLTVSAVTEGHLRAVRWAAQWESRKWAIEAYLSASRSGLAGGRGDGGAGSAKDDGRSAAFCSDSRQIGSDRRVGGGSCCAAGAGLAGRLARWPGPGGETAGRLSGTAGQGTNWGTEQSQMATPRTGPDMGSAVGFAEQIPGPR